MSNYREFVAYLPRPKSVDDWSDTSEVLERHIAALLATLGGGWKTEGPVDEAGSLYTASTRLIDEREQTIWFSFDYLDGAATMPRAVPDPMRFEVRVQEEVGGGAAFIPITSPTPTPTGASGGGAGPAHERAGPDRAGDRALTLVAVAAVGLTLVLGALAWLTLGWRAASGWLVPSLAVALALVGLVVARASAPAWVKSRLRPFAPGSSRSASPELLALAAAVERYLRGAFVDVELLDSDD